jgi:hypothetical protein
MDARLAVTLLLACRPRAHSARASPLAPSLTPATHRPAGAGASQEVSRLEQRVAELRQENQALTDDNKACYNVIRAREKELARSGGVSA